MRGLEEEGRDCGRPARATPRRVRARPRRPRRAPPASPSLDLHSNDGVAIRALTLTPSVQPAAIAAAAASLAARPRARSLARFRAAVATPEGTVLFVTEAGVASVADVAAAAGGALDDAGAAAAVAAAAAGLAALHASGAPHGDVRADNIVLLDADVCLADLAATPVDALAGGDGARARARAPWLPPEADAAAAATPAGDMYALGVTAVELLTGAPGPEAPPTASAAARAFVRACCAADPSSRPTAAAALTLPWLAGFDPAAAVPASLADGAKAVAALRARQRSPPPPRPSRPPRLSVPDDCADWRAGAGPPSRRTPLSSGRARERRSPAPPTADFTDAGAALLTAATGGARLQPLGTPRADARPAPSLAAGADAATAHLLTAWVARARGRRAG